MKTTIFTVAAIGIVAGSAAIPARMLTTGGASLGEPGTMLLLATALFGVAAVLRRSRGGAPRQ
jgi:hypothetical protein